MSGQSYEASLIARLLITSSTIQECDLSPSEFSNEQFRTVYDAIISLSNRGDVVDPITVSDELYSQTNQNWMGFLGDLIRESMPTTNVQMYCAAIRRSNEASKAVEIGQVLCDRATVEGAIDDAIRDLMALSLPNKRHQYSLDTAIKLALGDIEAAFNGERKGIPTGLIDLDEKLGGMHGGDLIVIGARPAMGKTAFLLNMAIAMVRSGCPVGMFSGEQDASQITQRLLAIRGGLSIMRMRNGSMQDEDFSKLSAAATSLKGTPMWIDDLASPSLNYIIRHARSWKHQHGVGAICIDYLQRMSCDARQKRHEAVGDNVRGLKNLARELDVPVIVLAQVGRDVEKRNDKRPAMGDLSDSSEIEKEADQVFMLYRDEVYHPETNDKGIAEILIDKNRHGPTGFVKTIWRGDCLRFENLSRAAA